MKQYPSIPRAANLGGLEFDAHLFAKLDGSNLRFEWSPKAGWFRAGSRHRLLDRHDPVLGPALDLFAADWADPLAAIARAQRWQTLTVFAEFYGPRSFAGQHVVGDPMTLSLFDASPFGGLIDPAEFLHLFGHLPIASYLGQFRWDRSLVERVWSGDLPGASFEGVVGKARVGREIVLAKAKTAVWTAAVRSRIGGSAAETLIAS